MRKRYRIASTKQYLAFLNADELMKRSENVLAVDLSGLLQVVELSSEAQEEYEQYYEIAHMIAHSS